METNLQSKTLEMPIEKITENMHSDDIHALKALDFYNFDKLLRKYKLELFDSESSFSKYKKELINCVKHGHCEPIKLFFDGVSYMVLSDMGLLLAHKVMGISPIVQMV